MDLFPKFVGKAGPPPAGGGTTCSTALNLGCFDGNTVTALWNYAQHFAMSDNSYSTVFGSHGAQDALTGAGLCGAFADSTALPGVNPLNTHALGRCGYGPRQPLLVVSPWARRNFVDHSITDQTSVLRFIEDNWLNGQRIGQGSFDVLANSITQMFDFTQDNDGGDGFLFLDPSTGEPINQRH